jgi:hypothetical protein
MALWPQLRSGSGVLLLAALALSLIRARDQPGADVAIGGTTASIVPGDVVLLAHFGLGLALILRNGTPRFAATAIGLAALFAVIVLGTAVANGATAVIGAVKLLELAALGLGAIALARRERTVEAIVDVLLLFTVAADVVGIVEFVRSGGGRQSSFLGEHDFAALATLPLLYGLVLLHERRRYARAATAIVAGSIGCILGAALASLLGLYLGAGALVVLAVVRRRVDAVALATTVATLAVITGGTLLIRSGDLGFLQSWFGSPPSRPGQYAASWSQRLVYAYIGGRVFLAHPALGTGWYPLLPAHEFAAYLPDARRRFSDQPPSYFPSAHGVYIPQQAYDQVLYETGLVGAAALLAFVGALVAGCRRSLRQARSLAALPAAWLAAALGALAGEGLFGGTPLAAVFWLVAGVVVACALAEQA